MQNDNWHNAARVDNDDAVFPSYRDYNADGLWGKCCSRECNKFMYDTRDTIDGSEPMFLEEHYTSPAKFASRLNELDMFVYTARATTSRGDGNGEEKSRKRKVESAQSRKRFDFRLRVSPASSKPEAGKMISVCRAYFLFHHRIRTKFWKESLRVLNTLVKRQKVTSSIAPIVENWEYNSQKTYNYLLAASEHARIVVGVITRVEEECELRVNDLHNISLKDAMSLDIIEQSQVAYGSPLAYLMHQDVNIPYLTSWEEPISQGGSIEGIMKLCMRVADECEGFDTFYKIAELNIGTGNRKREGKTCRFGEKRLENIVNFYGKKSMNGDGSVHRLPIHMSKSCILARIDGRDFAGAGGIDHQFDKFIKKTGEDNVGVHLPEAPSCSKCIAGASGSLKRNERIHIFSHWALSSALETWIYSDILLRQFISKSAFDALEKCSVMSVETPPTFCDLGVVDTLLPSKVDPYQQCSVDTQSVAVYTYSQTQPRFANTVLLPMLSELEKSCERRATVHALVNISAMFSSVFKQLMAEHNRIFRATSRWERAVDSVITKRIRVRISGMGAIGTKMVCDFVASQTALLVMNLKREEHGRFEFVIDTQVFKINPSHDISSHAPFVLKRMLLTKWLRSQDHHTINDMVYSSPAGLLKCLERRLHGASISNSVPAPIMPNYSSTHWLMTSLLTEHMQSFDELQDTRVLDVHPSSPPPTMHLNIVGCTQAAEKIPGAIGIYHSNPEIISLDETNNRPMIHTQLAAASVKQWSEAMQEVARATGPQCICLYSWSTRDFGVEWGRDARALFDASMDTSEKLYHSMFNVLRAEASKSNLAIEDVGFDVCNGLDTLARKCYGDAVHAALRGESNRAEAEQQHAAGAEKRRKKMQDVTGFNSDAVFMRDETFTNRAFSIHVEAVKLCLERRIKK